MPDDVFTSHMSLALLQQAAEQKMKARVWPALPGPPSQKRQPNRSDQAQYLVAWGFIEIKPFHPLKKKTWQLKILTFLMMYFFTIIIHTEIWVYIEYAVQQAKTLAPK